MTDPVISPDGKFMWTGSEWIPAPPTSEPDESPVSNESGAIIPTKVRAEAKVRAAAPILYLLGILVVFGIIGLYGSSNESIEGQWYIGNQQYWRFDSDGYFLSESGRLYHWSQEDNLLIISDDGIAETFRFEINEGWLFVAEVNETNVNDRHECFALYRNPIGEVEWLKAVDNMNLPEWCKELNW